MFILRSHVRLAYCAALLAACLFSAPRGYAQGAVLTGVVRDASNAVVPQVAIELVQGASQIHFRTKTNGTGFYSVPNIMPGTYTVTIAAPGYQTETLTNFEVNVGATLAHDFALKVGAQSEQVTVDGSGDQIDTTDASVSTVIGRNFVENMPLNGRSFQSLITLSPGTSVVPSGGVGQSGEISVNGQRTEANYYTVDGISANTGASVSSAGSIGGGFAGATPQESAIGTTQSIVSIDALEEFRESTSSYAAEYGRTPGGQFSFSTRSGTNKWHGSAFDFLRNDALDARNYFDTVKLPERQNDFGGTLGGPVEIPKLYHGHDKTFFFFSYEGLRLTQPQASQLYEVPSTALRQTAPAALQPFLAAFPTPNGQDLGNGLAYFTSGYASPSRLDTTSIRVDHSFGDRFKIFGRYSDVPSQSSVRAATDLAQVNETTRNIKTVVLGADAVLSSRMANEFRFGLTGNDYKSSRSIDNFGGATPLSIGSLPGFSNGDWLTFFLFYGLYPYYLIEPQSNRQRQINVVDSLTQTIGRHNVKYGVDFRRLITSEELPPLWEVAFFYDENSILNNQPSGLYVYTQSINMKAVTKNFSLYAQDDWKATNKLSISYGVRWDVNPAPTDANGNTPYTLNEITNLATATLAPKGTALWHTTYNNFAPRLGVAYEMHSTPGWQTVVRAGGGLFYDLGNTLSAEGYYGEGSTGFENLTGSAAFPATATQVAAAPAPSASAPYNATVFAYDPNLKLPYTGQWNVALEQGLGSQQSLTLNYVASASRRLLSQFEYNPYTLGNQAFSAGEGVDITKNLASSDYNSLQVKFDRKLSHGFQMLASYTWSHGLDNSTSNFLVYELERGPSDYDIRHNFQAALSYNVGGRYENPLLAYALTHWALDARVSARSALPVDVIQGSSVISGSGQSYTYHPNRDYSQPLYLYGSQYAGGRAINYAAFPATTPANGIEGDAGRNSARGFDAVQADLTLRRDFPFTERVGLQFRVEAYNILNHPIYGNVYNSLADGSSLFGQAYNTESSSLGGLSSLYQVGGARSMQVALRLHF